MPSQSSRLPKAAKYLAFATCLFALAGCIPVAVVPEDVTNTNEEVARRAWNLTGVPTAAARFRSRHTVTPKAIATPFGELHSVLADSKAGKPLIVFCGGNLFREQTGGAERALALEPFGDVLLFDYPGYGLSDGSGSRADFEAAREPIVAEANRIAAKRANKAIVYWGHSFGGTYCASLAAIDPNSAGLVVEGAYANIDAVVRGKAGMLSPFVSANVDDEAVNYDIPRLLKRYGAPVVVIATRADETVPFDASRALADELADRDIRTRFIELSSARHRTIFKDPNYAPQVAAALRDLDLLK